MSLSVLGVLIILFYSIILMLCITLLIASITLLERKILSLLQRRVGPNFVGYRGRLQYLADAIKLLVKGVGFPDKSNKLLFICIPSVVGAVCYSFWVNAVWGPSLSLYDIEYNIVLSGILSVLFGLGIMLTGYASNNKYAVLASVRSALLMLNLEIFLGLLFLNIVLISGSFTFSALVVLQEATWLIVLFLAAIFNLALIFLLEVNRAPFDLAEAEAELVAGYSVEYGGFYFAFYYLGEYFHLFFFSMLFSIFFFGGWAKLPVWFLIEAWFLIPIPHDWDYYIILALHYAKLIFDRLSLCAFYLLIFCTEVLGQIF